MIRKAVICTIAVVFLLCPKVNANQNNNVSKVKETIVKHSLEMGIDPALALSIAKSESGFRHDARSVHGAVGVFQLMPSTAKRLGVNPYYMSENIRGGLMYYKKLYQMFGSTELALAAYNAGPGTVKRCNNSVPPIKETKRFVTKIMAEYNYQKNTPDPAIIKIKHSNSATGKSFAHSTVNVKSEPVVHKTKIVTVPKNIKTVSQVKTVHKPVPVTKTKTNLAPIVLPPQGVI